MDEHALFQIAALMILGVGTTWLASLLRVPSIFPLLVVGIVAGPIAGLLDPDEVFGESLFPIVSLAVAVILFEGGLQLNVRRIRETRVAVLDLVLLGSLITWCLSAVFAGVVLDLPLPLCLLLGATLVVTGPTVIMPILRNIRPRGRVGPVMRWDAIVNDPLGAVLAFLVFEWICTGQGFAAGTHVARLGATLLAGAAMGLAGAAFLLLLLRRFWVPDHLQNPFALMVAIAAFTVSNALMSESGLLAVTLMGVLLANQNRIGLHHIKGFQEDLRVLLIGILFIALSARMDPAVLREIELDTLLYLVLLILVVRPVAVFLSTLGSHLSVREKILLAWMAPRGIVAAAVTSVFALRLEALGYEGSDRLLSVVFLIIVGTVAVGSLTARPLAVRLQLASRYRRGLLFIGANRLAREFARELNRHGVDTLLVGHAQADTEHAHAEGLTVITPSLLDRRSLEEIDLSDIGTMIAISSSEELNLLAILQWEEFFGRSHVYHLPPDSSSLESAPSYRLEGRLIGMPPVDYDRLEALREAGAGVSTVHLDGSRRLRTLHEETDGNTWPAFVVSPDGSVIVVSESSQEPPPGSSVIALVRERSRQCSA
jgi:NhaP-type Na+/H+ or K+/H+ antiporter